MERGFSYLFRSYFQQLLLSNFSILKGPVGSSNALECALNPNLPTIHRKKERGSVDSF